jgi:hypothetical protein
MHRHGVDYILEEDKQEAWEQGFSAKTLHSVSAEAQALEPFATENRLMTTGMAARPNSIGAINILKAGAAPAFRSSDSSHSFPG